MNDRSMQQDHPTFSKLEAAVLFPNLLLVAVVVLCFVAYKGAPPRVAPLVETDTKTTRRIHQLELSLERQPANISSVIELAKLYREAGEFPWSYQALKNAERSGGDREPSWQLMLGLAFLELGKNKDAVRVLDSALERCGRTRCASNTQVKLEIFTQVARIFLKRRIDARMHNRAAEKVLHEILKPVGVDPEKMRPKAPASPEPPESAPPAKPKS